MTIGFGLSLKYKRDLKPQKCFIILNIEIKQKLGKSGLTPSKTRTRFHIDISQRQLGTF